MRKSLLAALVFFVGGALLVLEVAANRVLSPYYGSTIYTFSSVLGVVLGGLSCGYLAGGRLADRPRPQRSYFVLLYAGGLSVLLLAILAQTLLRKLGLELSVARGPLVFALLLFFLPCVLLGMLSPLSVRLWSELAPGQGMGSVSGQVFFWSTLGSIAGSLGSGFFLVPYLGVGRTVLATGGLLALLGFFGMSRLGMPRHERISLPATGLGLFALAFACLGLPHYPGALASRDGLYEQVTIYETQSEGRPARVLLQDRAVSGLVYLDTGEALDYLRYFALAELFRSPLRRVLVLGGGSYVLPRLLLERYPQAQIDVVEIEPCLFELARRHFGLPQSPRLQNHLGDGRRFLHDAPAGSYDLIFSDVYFGLSVPPHFATREFFALARERLAPDGLFMANFVGDLRKEPPAVVPTLLKTLRAAFENTLVFAADSPESLETQNVVAVGVRGTKRLELSGAAVSGHPDAIIRTLGKHLLDSRRFDWQLYPTLTDDYAPVEYLATNALRRELD